MCIKLTKVCVFWHTGIRIGVNQEEFPGGRDFKISQGGTKKSPQCQAYLHVGFANGKLNICPIPRP